MFVVCVFKNVEKNIYNFLALKIYLNPSKIYTIQLIKIHLIEVKNLPGWIDFNFFFF